MKEVVLVIAAHPDDEVLGCGGSIAKLSKQGAAVHIAFLADGVFSRAGDAKIKKNELIKRRLAAENACKVLGAQSVSFGEMPDNQLDTIPLLDIIGAVEKVIKKYKPNTVFTHHGGDLNVDHRLTHDAVVTACRPQSDNSVKTLLFYEVPSSTEWQSPNSALCFTPNWFIDISDELNLKMQALDAYHDELRSWPHPRSIKGVEHLARWRGATICVGAAEAFMLGRKIF
jgi:LmbE family N-acetylglucosaminyl deacetylase